MTQNTDQYAQALGHRLAQAAKHFPTKSAASEAAGVSLEQFNKWIRGDVKVPINGLYGLCHVSNIDFNWLCTGTRHTSQYAIEFVDALEALETYLIAQGITDTPTGMERAIAIFITEDWATGERKPLSHYEQAIRFALKGAPPSTA